VATEIAAIKIASQSRTTKTTLTLIWSAAAASVIDVEPARAISRLRKLSKTS
jgi:hypothetical protein